MYSRHSVSCDAKREEDKWGMLKRGLVREANAFPFHPYPIFSFAFLRRDPITERLEEASYRGGVSNKSKASRKIC